MDTLYQLALQNNTNDMFVLLRDSIFLIKELSYLDITYFNVEDPCEKRSYEEYQILSEYTENLLSIKEITPSIFETILSYQTKAMDQINQLEKHNVMIKLIPDSFTPLDI